MALLTCNHKSEKLGKAVALTIIVPDNPKKEKLRVLYLLHGLSDDCSAWTRYTSIERYMRQNGDTVVVMPDGQKSFYSDMVYGDKYYSYITEELPEYLKTIFNISGKREDTYIAGLSMGGYGAFKIALSKPQNYAAAASFSGVLDVVPHMKEAGEWSELGTAIMGQNANPEKSGANLFYLLENGVSPKPRLLQMCGTEDFLYEDNKKFKNEIEKLDFEYEYEEFPGEHNWDFWDKCIRKAIKFFNIENE